MAKPLDDNDDKALDPAVERVRRRMVRFVAINLGILFVALMAVVLALVYRMNVTAPAPAPEAAGDLVPNGEGLIEGRIALPAGARINAHAVSANRLTLDVTLTDGTRSIFVYDMAARRMIGRFDIASQP